jgi:hypothetical protein
LSLSVGDAVLTFLADSSQLDQAFARIPEQSEKAMSAAADSVGQVGAALKGVQFELDATGSNAAYAGGEIRDSMGGAGVSVAQLEEKIALVKERMAELSYEASFAGQATALLSQAFGELGGVLVAALGVEAFKSQIEGVQKSILALELLSEKTGIAINTMAGIEHVSAAAGVAFDQVSTALTRLSRAQILAIEGGQQQIAAFQRIGISTSELKTLAPEELFYRVGEALANASSHGAAAASAFGLLGKGGAALIPIFQQNREELRVMVDEAAKSSGVTKDAANSAREWEAQTANLSEAWRSVLIPLMKGSVPVIRAVETAASSVAMVIRDLAAVFGGLGLVFIDQAKAMGVIFDDVIHGNFSKLESDGKKLAETLTHDLGGIGVQFKQEWANTADYIKHVWTDVNPLKPMKDDLSDVAGKQKDLAKVAKGALDEQLANIDAWKAAQHAAYESHQIDLAQWLAAEVHASDAAEIAHEHYLQRLVELSKQAGDAAKIQTAEEELNAFQIKSAADATDKLATAMDKHREATHKVAMEYGKLIEAGVEKDFNATAIAAERLTRAEEGLLKAETKLAEDKVSQHFKDQEAAISRLADLHLITEKQKNDRLALLEKEQADEALAILTDQLAKEKAVMAAAETKVTAAKSNPFLTPAQVLDLEVNLKKAQIAVTNTESAIVQTREKYNKQSEALDKGYYGRALALAVAYGRELLAEQLKENHASLLTKQAQLDEAKARGVNTTALQHEIAALKQNEQQLQKQANGNKQAIAAELQLRKAQLLATQAILDDAKAHGLDTAAIEKHVQALKAEVSELQKAKQGTNNLSVATDKLKQDTEAAATEMLSSLSTAFEGIITGQQSFGKAMEDATFKMIGKMAMSWGEYFAAKGIADIFMDPPLGGAELAASAALFAMSGVMSGLASGSGSSSHSSVNNVSSSNNPTGVSQSSSSGGGSTQTVSVTKLAAGGIVSRPTMFMAGDSASGGSAAEAVIPLTDPAALARISNALLSAPTLRAASAGMTSTANLAAASGASPTARFDDATITKLGERIGSHLDSSGTTGDTTNIHVHVKGSIDHGTIAGLVQKINRKVGNRQLTLNATNSQRLTRRSQ